MRIGITINTSQMTLAELLTTKFHRWHEFVTNNITAVNLQDKLEKKLTRYCFGENKEGTSPPFIKTSSNCNKTALVHVV